MSVDISVVGKKVTADLICDSCGVIIASFQDTGIDAAERGLPKERYKDQNWGHECARCRQLRCGGYDKWVTRTSEGEA